MRPLFWHHQDDQNAVAASDQFLLGPHLLVAPIVRQSATARSVYLPRGDWYDFWTGQRYAGGRHVLALADLEIIPIFVRAGAIVPMGLIQQYVGEKPSDLIELHLWPGSAGELCWYEDDGKSMEYEHGKYAERLIAQISNDRAGSLQLAEVRGELGNNVKAWRIILHEIADACRVTDNAEGIETEYHAAARTLSFDVLNRTQPIRIDWRNA